MFSKGRRTSLRSSERSLHAVPAMSYVVCKWKAKKMNIRRRSYERDRLDYEQTVEYFRH